MSKMLTALLSLAALACMVTPFAFAQKSPDPLESRLVARKVVMVDGRESFAEAATAKPGDVIEYVATYRNAGKSAITGLQATLPIPGQTELVAGSARPAQARASLDGLAFSDIPLRRRVSRDGKAVEEDVPLREYRALRWAVGELGAGRSASFSARVRVLGDQPASGPGGQGRGP